MKEIDVSFGKWKEYCHAIGDYNPIHWMDESAESFGLEGIVAPGMFVASQMFGGREITEMKAKFGCKVYDGDKLVMNDDGGNYIFNRGEDFVCDVRGVKINGYGCDELRPIEDEVHRYIPTVTGENIAKFQKSVGYFGSKNFPGMFLAALSGPALFDYEKSKEFLGVHVFQSFRAHSSFEGGYLDVVIGDETTLGPLHSYNMRWVERVDEKEEVVVASGEATVLKLERDEILWVQ